MGLFNFFNRKSKDEFQLSNPSTATELPEIPENVFIEKDQPASTKENSDRNITGINLLYEFLERDYEAAGYDDALVNPDSSHLEQNISGIKNDLARVILKVKTFYEDFIREVDQHIASRSRCGMIDTVEELKVKKETAENHIKQILEIEELAKNNEGVGQGIIISYTKGFRNGLAAISHHSIIKVNF